MFTLLCKLSSKIGKGLSDLQMDFPENDPWLSFKVAAGRD